MAVDSRIFRDALGRFASGVAIVAATPSEGGAVGVTITSFTSLSLDPPLVLYCLGRNSSNFDALIGAPAFSINILTADQQALSELFASQSEDKFAGLAVIAGRGGVPLIGGCLAHLECIRISVHPGGDHDIVIGRVDGIRRGEGEPLLRYRGTYCGLGDVLAPPLAPVSGAGVK